MKNESVKLGLILALYATLSCTILAFVNNLTSKKIDSNQKRKIDYAMKEFFPEDGLSFQEVESIAVDSSSVDIDKIILAKKGSQIVGGASQVTGPTYDKGTILVGMDKEGFVTGLKFLKLSDSPGFGLKASDSTFLLPSGKTFYGQFEGKNARDGFVAGVTFDAISGATITSDGVASLITEGTKALFAEFEKNGKQGE